MSIQTPYKPYSLVYFITEEGIKSGIVSKVVTTLTCKGTRQEWIIKEYIKPNGNGDPYPYIEHNVTLNRIANTLEAMSERTDLIYSFRKAKEVAEKFPEFEKEEDIFA